MIHTSPGLIPVLAWFVTLSWLWKTIAAARGLPRIPNLLHPQYDTSPAGEPWLTVIVPARDEAENIKSCLESLLAQDYPRIQIIAVNDRSADATGSLMDAIAAAHPPQLKILHITELPPGWLGKTHAMAMAAREASVLVQPEFLLFTDADVVFRPDALRRTLAHAVAVQADHMVTMPTALVRRWDEGLVLGFFQIFGLWVARPWKVEDPKAMRDAVGVGAFNMLRRSAYLEIGGFEAQKMDILEDLTLARRVKQAGLRQRISFGVGLANVHWAAGARGLVGVMTKNLFSGFRFHLSLALLACGWLAVFAVAPAFEIFYRPTRLPALVLFAVVVWAYRLYGKNSGVSAWNAVYFPFGGMVFIITLLRSSIVTLRQGGVRWRGTFYSLKELRASASPLRWR